MIKVKLTLLLFFTSTNLWAFPSIFEIIEDNTKLIVSCVEGVEPIAQIGDIAKIANHLDCDSQPVEKYCECINKQNPNDLNEAERSILNMELGFFGKDDDIEMLDMLERMTRLQQVLSGYENISNGKKSCFKGTGTIAETDIKFSLETVLEKLDDSEKVPLPYFKSSYVNMAKDLQRSVQAGETINFDNEGRGDAKFLVQLATTLANGKPELLTESFSPTPDLLVPNIFIHQSPTDGNQIVTWQDSVKAMIEGHEEGSFDGSPLFQSLKDTLGREKSGEYIPNRDAFFDSLVSTVRALGLEKQDVENLKIGIKPPIDLVKKRMGSPFFSDAVSKVADSMCLSLSQEFLWKAKTEDPTNGLMSVERIRKNASKGSELIKQFSVLDPSKPEDRPKLKEMIRVRNNMFSKMVSQFDDYRTAHPSKETDEKIKKYIESKKISMGKLWCGERKIQEELGDFETTVVKANEVAPETVQTMTTVQDYKEELLKHELEGTQIDEEIGEVKRKISRYQDELAFSRTQLQVEEANLRLAKLDPNTTENELNNLVGRVKGYRKNLAIYPALIKKEEDNKTRLAALLGDSRRAQRMMKKKIRETVSEAIESDTGWFGKWGQEERPQRGRRGRASGDQTSTIHSEPAMNEEVRRRVLTDYKVVPSSGGTGSSGSASDAAASLATRIVKIEHGDQNTVSYDSNTDEYVVRTNREEALDQAVVTTKIINTVRESTGRGLREGTSEDVLDSISGTMSSLANDVSNSLELNDVGEEGVEDFKKTIAKFDSDMSPVLGEMNFTALGEFDSAKSVDQITDSHLSKQLGTVKKQGVDLAANLAGKLQETFSPSTNENTIEKNPVSGLASPEGIKAGPEVASNLAGTSLSKLKGQTAKERAKSIFNARKKNSRSQSTIEEELEVQEADPLKTTEIEKLQREIAQEKKAKEKLDREIRDSKGKRDKLASRSLEKEKQEDPVVATPGLKPSVTPTPFKGKLKRNTSSGGSNTRKINSVKSGSVGSAASSTGNVGAVVDGRVKGGVIVNGEFIPQALLSTKVAASVKDVPNSDLILSSNSTYDMEPISSANKMSGVPVVKSDKFSKLTPEEKEIFIQEQLTRLRAEEILIEVEDGTNLLVKSTVKLRTRLSVAGLNQLLEKADE